MTTVAPNRYEAVLSQINTLQIRKAALEETVAQSFEDESHARISAIEENPGERSDKSGARSPVGQIVKRRRDAEAALGGLTEELAACGVVFQKLKSEHEAEQLERIAEEVSLLDAAERDHIRRLTDGLEKMLMDWNALVSFYKDRQQAVFLDGEFVDHAAGDVAMNNGRAPSLSPTPMDFLGLVEMLVEASCDPRGLGVREGAPVALNGTAFEGWATATRDLRELNAVNVVPPNARPRYSSSSGPRAHHGEGREAVYVTWRDANGNLPGSKPGRFGG
jgi:hypothetical protein